MNSAAQKELASSDYWNSRYANEKGNAQNEQEEYEWFKTFEKLRSFFEKHLPLAKESPAILQLGCGKSVGNFENRQQVGTENTLVFDRRLIRYWLSNSDQC